MSQCHMIGKRQKEMKMMTKLYSIELVVSGDIRNDKDIPIEGLKTIIINAFQNDFSYSTVKFGSIKEIDIKEECK